MASRSYIFTTLETHFEVKKLHLENSAAKHGKADKCCLLEVRLAGEHPVAASEHAQTVGEAVTGATRKMANLLDTELGKRRKW